MAIAINGVTHIIVDEVHERDVDTDFLLGILREVLKIRKDLKLILMSATMDANLFVKYFGGGCPVIKIPGFVHPIKEYYLEDILEYLANEEYSNMSLKKQEELLSLNDDVYGNSNENDAARIFQKIQRIVTESGQNVIMICWPKLFCMLIQ